MNAQPDIEVFYDGECPICRWEVRLYGRTDKAKRIRWIDIITLEPRDLPAGKTKADLLGRFHVRDLSNSMTSHHEPQEWHIGVDAFARIWRVLPGWHHFAGVFKIPVIRQVAMLGYRLFLKWQSWHRGRRSC